MMGMATSVAIPSSLASAGYWMRGSVAGQMATGRPLKASEMLYPYLPGFVEIFSLRPTDATSSKVLVLGLTIRMVQLRFITWPSCDNKIQDFDRQVELMALLIS
jgi:hypothetical protein